MAQYAPSSHRPAKHASHPCEPKIEPMRARPPQANCQHNRPVRKRIPNSRNRRNLHCTMRTFRQPQPTDQNCLPRHSEAMRMGTSPSERKNPRAVARDVSTKMRRRFRRPRPSLHQPTNPYSPDNPHGNSR